MRHKFNQTLFMLALVAFSMSACKKDPIVPSPQPGPQPNRPVEMMPLKLQAMITIGSINYDSIPAQFRIMSWDSANVPTVKDTILAAGVNSVMVPKHHIRYQVLMDKWGISDAISLTREQAQSDVVHVLGGSKAAKRLRKEETFLFAMDAYQPSSRAHYAYSGAGLSSVEFYQKKPQHAALQFTHKHVYNYVGGKVSRIDMFNEVNAATGFTAFTYNAQGTKIMNMHQQSFGVETYAAVTHAYPAGHAEITIDYLYDNGNAMEYVLMVKGGNKVEERAISSTGAGESATYRHDFNINPFAHMNMPDMFLSNLSKNNVIDQQQSYSGSIPTSVVYRYEYTYDSDGYPVEVIKHYKSFLSGKHLYKTKTVYTYM